jgi:hypothetical protein
VFVPSERQAGPIPAPCGFFTFRYYFLAKTGWFQNLTCWNRLETTAAGFMFITMRFLKKLPYLVQAAAEPYTAAMTGPKAIGYLMALALWFPGQATL